MAIRTTDGLVRAVLLKNYDTTNRPDLAPFISEANGLTNRVAVVAGEKGVSLPSDVLRDIETNLAAYFYCFADPLKSSKSTGDASASYMRESFLEKAKMLDYTGTLTAILSPRKIRIGWLGKRPSAQIPWWQRQ